ncbi:TPA: major capsid protein E [Elizabethkingia anophelis]|uniref:major capsid protein n=1 Tax=Elizabethkingia anophelis TaxID=1117645 RepID=UPI00296BBBF3|nr:major capsid protein [Elizabethkingia anophelis]HAY3504280.1 major capsid protein E [Elizabethkingia anophelis]HAY3512258.1 major capsid protein E [Elizabethkingia anophelis]HAY3516509.1 major capsid protein E [Elizabethkingia anophelis]HAY3520375.1 major capsid protein E [Elizabethkingia anophelis]
MSDILLQKIMPEYREVDLGAILNANPLGELQYKNYFPSEFKTGLTFGNLEGDTGAKVIAPIVAMDSDVILKGRDNTEAIKGEIPKVEVGRKKTEKDFFKINELRNAVTANPNNKNIRLQLINKIYDDAIFVTDSVNASMEYMSKSLLSQGFYEMNGIKIDFGVTMQDETSDWFLPANAATFDPIKEFQKLQKQALAKGFRYLRAVMDLATFNQLVASEKVIKFTASFAQNALGLAQTPTLAQVNSALQAQNLPVIEIWESYVNDEAKDGTLTSMSGWILGNIHFSGTADFGNTQYTISPEASIDLNETSKLTTNEFILVSTIAKAAPMQVLTKATAFATPVLNSVKKRLILKTKLA